MGCYPEAMLFYGFSIGIEGEDNEEEENLNIREIEENWEDKYFAAIGKVKPPSPVNWKDESAADLIAWREDVKYRRYNKPPFDVKMFGSEYSKGWAVILNESYIGVQWDEVAYPTMPDYSAHDEAMKDFCEKAGIPFHQPKWCLCARYF